MQSDPARHTHPERLVEWNALQYVRDWTRITIVHSGFVSRTYNEIEMSFDVEFGDTVSVFF